MGGICGTRVSVCSVCITTAIVLTVLLGFLVATNVNHIATGTTPHAPALSGAEGEVAGEVEDSLDTMTTVDPTGIEIETVRNAMMMNTVPQEVVAVDLLTIDSMPVGTEDIVTHPKMPMGYPASHSILRHLRLLR
jgi:hypothetical protein